MDLLSTAFLEGEAIPQKYTCDDLNVSPPLTFSQVPVEAQKLVLIVEDPDAPTKPGFTHWLVYNIPSSIIQVLEDTTPEYSLVGMNDFGVAAYGGPCPPSGTHRYVFTLYALDAELNLPAGAAKGEVESKMQGHIIDTSRLTGIYSR